MASTEEKDEGNKITVAAVIEQGAGTESESEKTSGQETTQPPEGASGEGQLANGDSAAAAFTEEQLRAYAGDESGNYPLYEDRKPVGNYECKYGLSFILPSLIFNHYHYHSFSLSLSYHSFTHSSDRD